MSENPIWGDDWGSVRDQWVLDPEVTFLNHGSFGACPRPVLDRQSNLRHEMEREPVEFLARRLPGLLQDVRERVGAFLNADPEGVVFVPNATTGVATVLAAMGFRPGDQVVLTDHAYPAVANAIARAGDRWGVEPVIRHVPLPPPDPEEIAAVVAGGITERTRLVVIDHVTSATGVVFPVEEVVSACRSRGTPVLVDAAHAPGMLALDVAGLGADFWTGNFHKWVCAPRGTAALVIAAAHRGRVLPLVTSHGYGGTLHEEFDWPGTHDPTAALSVPAAFDFMEALGWERVRDHNHRLAALGQRLVAEALGTEPPVPESRFGSMALVSLPAGVVLTQDDAEARTASLFEVEGIEVPLTLWGGRGFARLSAQVYNCPADYERLAGALPRRLAS